MEEEKKNTTDLGEGSVGRLLMKLALPAIVEQVMWH